MQFSRIFVSGLLLLLSYPVVAEHPTSVTDPVIPNLPKLTHSSGYIFSGTVKSVERIVSSNRNSVAVMRITFQVDRGMLGVSSGKTLSINEWTGLWQSGERYRVGEQVLLFLYPPSKLGLTSPVGGWTGRFSVNRGGEVTPKPAPGSGRTPLPPWTRPSPGIHITIDDVAREVQRASEE